MKTVKLGDICVKITDGSHYSPKAQIDGESPYITVRDINDDLVDFENCKLISKKSYDDLVNNGCKPEIGDLLFSKDGTVGKVSLVNYEKDFVVLSSLAIIRPDQSKILPEYLFHILKSPYFLNQAIGKKSGAAIRRIILRDLKNIDIAIEEDREKQKNIVARLDAAFDKITKTEVLMKQNINNVNLLQKSVLAKYLGNTDNIHRLGDICGIVSKLIDPRAEPYSGQFHIGAANIKSETGTLINLQIAKQEKLISGKFPFDTNMVLYSKIRPYLKKVARPEFEGICSADIYPLVPNELLDKNYLFYVLLSDKFTRYAIEGSQRAGMPKVNREHLFAYELHIPDIKTQETTAAKMDNAFAEITKLISKYTQKLQKLGDLRQSLLAEAFSTTSAL